MPFSVDNPYTTRILKHRVKTMNRRYCGEEEKYPGFGYELTPKDKEVEYGLVVQGYFEEYIKIMVRHPSLTSLLCSHMSRQCWKDIQKLRKL